MKNSAAQVLRDAQQLSESDRTTLIEKLLESWSAPEDMQDDESFLAVLDRRTEEAELGTAKTLSWDEVKESARAAVRGKR